MTSDVATLDAWSAIEAADAALDEAADEHIAVAVARELASRRLARAVVAVDAAEEGVVRAVERAEAARAELIDAAAMVEAGARRAAEVCR